MYTHGHQDERREAFVQAINEAQERYGYRLVAAAVPRVYGTAVMVEAQLAIEAIPGWHQHGEAEGNDHAATGSKP